jgi:hypothetical protein
MARLRVSGRARCFAATAEAAAVRTPVIQVASMTLIGIPVAESFRMRRPLM